MRTRPSSSLRASHVSSRREAGCLVEARVLVVPVTRVPRFVHQPRMPSDADPWRVRHAASPCTGFAHRQEKWSQSKSMRTTAHGFPAGWCRLMEPSSAPGRDERNPGELCLPAGAACLQMFGCAQGREPEDGENDDEGSVEEALARERAWKAGAAPGRVILDFDATPVSIHSEKELAAGHYKGGFGFNPLLASLGREVLAGVLRPGNAGANNAEDHLEVLELALEQLPESALDGEILARSDSAGASHAFASGCRECRIRFSLGYAINNTVREQILALGESAWTPAVNQDGQPRDGAWVTELTGLVNLDSWPQGTRLICRRERPHPGAQLSFTDVNGHRFQCFITDQPPGRTAGAGRHPPTLEGAQRSRPDRGRDQRNIRAAVPTRRRAAVRACRDTGQAHRDTRGAGALLPRVRGRHHARGHLRPAHSDPQRASQSARGPRQRTRRPPRRRAARARHRRRPQRATRQPPRRAQRQHPHARQGRTPNHDRHNPRRRTRPDRTDLPRTRGSH
jgi:Transposase DDE domain group 1